MKKLAYYLSLALIGTPLVVGVSPLAHAAIVKFQPAGVPNVACMLPKLPANAKVIAVTADRGRELDFQLDQSGYSAYQLDLAVHADTPVILLLNSYVPMVWNIGWTSGTKIIGAYATGYHRQVIAGLPKAPPIVTAWSDHPNRAGCAGTYLESLNTLSSFAQENLHRSITKVYDKPTPSGYVAIDEATRQKSEFRTSSDRPPASFKNPSAPLAGPAGLDDAVKKGLLRPATEADRAQLLAAYQAVQAEKQKAKLNPSDTGTTSVEATTREIPHFIKGYVILKPFKFPAGLYGGSSATFIVPPGVAKPTGDYGHSTIIYLSDMHCEGFPCDTN